MWFDFQKNTRAVSYKCSLGKRHVILRTFRHEEWGEVRQTLEASEHYLRILKLEKIPKDCGYVLRSRRFKLRLTHEQRKILRKWMNAARRTYNAALAACLDPNNPATWNWRDLQKRFVTNTSAFVQKCNCIDHHTPVN